MIRKDQGRDSRKLVFESEGKEERLNAEHPQEHPRAEEAHTPNPPGIETPEPTGSADLSIS